MKALGKNAEIRKKAVQFVKIDYIPLFIVCLLHVVLKNGTDLVVYCLKGTIRSGFGLGSIVLGSMVSEAVSFFLVLGAYRMCVEQVRGGERSFLGFGFAFRGRERVWRSFICFLLVQIPTALGFLLSLFRRFYPQMAELNDYALAQWMNVTSGLLSLVESLFFQLVVQMVLFPALLVFVLYPGRGAAQAFGRGIPLGLRRWPSIVFFRTVNALPAVLAANIVASLVGAAVFERLCPSLITEQTVLSMIDMLSGQALQRAEFWSNWARGLSHSLVLAFWLPWLRMCDVLFAGERLGLGVKGENGMTAARQREKR